MKDNRIDRVGWQARRSSYVSGGITHSKTRRGARRRKRTKSLHDELKCEDSASPVEILPAPGEMVTERATEDLPIQPPLGAPRLGLRLPLGVGEGKEPMCWEPSELCPGPLLSLLVGAKGLDDAAATDRNLSPPSLSQDTPSPRRNVAPAEEDEGGEEVVRMEVWNGVVHDGVENALVQTRFDAEPEAVGDLEPSESVGTEIALSDLEEDVDRFDSLLGVDLDGLVAVVAGGVIDLGVFEQAAVPACSIVNGVSAPSLKSTSTKNPRLTLSSRGC
jgi:hypothetical protein